MEESRVAPLGRQMFGLLVSLLRPIVRVAGGGLAVDLRSGARLLPRQGGEIVLTGGRHCTQLLLRQEIFHEGDVAMSTAFTFALPRGAVLSRLTVGSHGVAKPAGAGPRWAVREEFDALRRGGGSAALVSEDAPGIFSYELAGAAHGRALATTVQADIPNQAEFTNAAGLRLRVRFDTEEPSIAAPPPRRRVMRLGTSRILDAVIGIVSRHEAGFLASHSDPCRDHPLTSVGAANSEADATDVFVTCERSDGAAAAFRGCIADRPLRLVLELQDKRLGGGFALPADIAFARLNSLLAAYESSHDEGARRQAAREISELGLAQRCATLWTSLLAVGASVHDPEGERAHAVA